MTVEEVASRLRAATRVIVVPGYGVAVGRAQHELAALVRGLAHRGVAVQVVVHPVAGRLPGHLDLLLDEAGLAPAYRVPPGERGPADLALVVGADDIVNPAARTDPASPLFGLDTVDLRDVATVVMITAPNGRGHADVPNPLRDPPTLLLEGDAATLLAELGRLAAAP